MKKSLSPFLAIFILFSCNTEQEKKMNDKTTPQDTIAPFQIRIITGLPDSLQPNTIRLDTMPKPLKAIVPKTGGLITRLAALQNEKGETILDTDGRPFMLGHGGQSNFTNFTTDNGLALDAINCSLMDKIGNLWFGTYGGGVSRYDGESFVNFTTAQGLANNVVYSILEDRKGNIWFGTNSGVNRYDGESFVRFTTTQGLADDVVLSILEDKAGNIWFGTNGGGVSRFDGASFSSYTTAQGLANDVVYSIAEDKEGNLWFGTYGGGVSRYNGESFVSFTTAHGLGNNNVFSILNDKAGNLWFGTIGNGVSRYDGESFVNFSTAQGLANNIVLNILEDKAGNIWFGTYGGGVSCYNGQSFVSFTTAQGLANDNIYSILEDKSGNLWFSTNGGGVSRYDGKSFVNFTTTQGLANNVVFSISEDRRGNIWFGTEEGGVSRYDEESFVSFTTAEGLPDNTVYSILEDKAGNLWFGTNGGGVGRFDGESFVSFTTAQGLANNVVYSILEDKTGNLWFGTNGGGVSRFDGESFVSFTDKQGLANNLVWSILEDKNGNLWFGTYGGVSRYDGKSIVSFTANQGLASNVVYSILEDKNGNLWFGTDEGLSLLRADKIRGLADHHALSGIAQPDTAQSEAITSSTLFKSFKIADGLPDNFVTQVIQLPNGKIAVGTNLGITLFDPSEDFTKLTQVETYNSSTGYPVKDVNVGQNCLYLDNNGVIWAGTGSEKTALVRFDYTALHRSTEPPAVVIDAVKVNEENICWHNLRTGGVRKTQQDSAKALVQEFFAYGKSLSVAKNDSILQRFGHIKFDSIAPFYPLPQNLELPYEHNHISFEFTAIETGRPFLVKYQYFLEGYDKDWSPVTSLNNASFGNIYEGTYTFKLKAQGANGVWSEPVIYTFKVLPPWYRTWWAYLIYAILFLLALRTFIKWRERHLRAEKEKLEKIVDERTEELVQKNIIVEKERQRSDELLLNILPEEVARELKAKGAAEAKYYDAVTVLFTDFKDFTQLTEQMKPRQLVEEIHTCFKAFDAITEKYGIEKIKTIGDSYMCAGGLPVANKTHAGDVVQAGLDIQQFILKRMKERAASNEPHFQIRIGIHTGPVVAGIVGIKKFAYDIWGDTVNTASRMESSGEAGKINISGATYEQVKDQFTCTYRGKVSAKGKGNIDMYYVEGRI